MLTIQDQGGDSIKKKAISCVEARTYSENFVRQPTNYRENFIVLELQYLKEIVAISDSYLPQINHIGCLFGKKTETSDELTVILFPVLKVDHSEPVEYTDFSLPSVLRDRVQGAIQQAWIDPISGTRPDQMEVINHYFPENACRDSP